VSRVFTINLGGTATSKTPQDTVQGYESYLLRSYIFHLGRFWEPRKERSV